MRFKNLFQLTVSMLAIISSKGDVIADQKNSIHVAAPLLDGDPCNVGEPIYMSCQDTTKGLPNEEFISCMEKIGSYTDRDGDKCCPDPDFTKQYSDCEPPKPVSSGGMTPLQKGLFSGGIIIAGVAILAVSKKAYNSFSVRPDRPEVARLLENLVAPGQRPEAGLNDAGQLEVVNNLNM